PSPLKVKEGWVEDRRYVVCLNEDQATKDRHDREAILAALKGVLKQGDKALIGNRGYRRYVKANGERFSIDDDTIRGHVFCSFLALLLRYELERRLEQRGIKLEWTDVIRDLDRLQQIELLIEQKKYLLRTETRGTVAKVFQACGVALPPTLQIC